VKRLKVWESLEQRGLPLRKSGDHFALTNCPFPDHDDENPSFSVDLNTGYWRCFGCHREGRFKGLIALLDGVEEDVALRRVTQPQPVSEYKKRLIDFLDREESESIKYYSTRSFKATFPPVHGTDGETYLKGRGIDGESLDRFLIRWGGSSGTFRRRVVLPIRTHDGKLLSFVGRAADGGVEPKTRKARPASAAVYGLFELIQDQGFNSWHRMPKIVCVEGELDAVFLQQHGVPAVSVMGTSNMNPTQMRLIRNFAHRAVLLYDGDEAGRRAVNGHYDRKGNYAPGHYARLKRYVPTLVYDLPDGTDPNDMTPDQIDELKAFLEV